MAVTGRLKHKCPSADELTKTKKKKYKSQFARAMERYKKALKMPSERIPTPETHFRFIVQLNVLLFDSVGPATKHTHIYKTEP